MIDIRVTAPSETSDHELVALRAAVGEFGFADAVVDRARRRRSSDDLVMTIVIATPMAAFFTTLGESAAHDAYDTLKRLAGRLRNILKRPDALLRIDGNATGVRVDLPPGLPDEAYAALRQVDFSDLAEGELRWDPDRNVWVHED